MRAIFLTKLANLKSQRNSFLNSRESKINSNNDSKRTHNSITTKPTIFSYLELKNIIKIFQNQQIVEIILNLYFKIILIL